MSKLPSLSEHDLKKLRQKASITRLSPSKSLQDIAKDVGHYENVLLHRKGLSNKTHRISLQTGKIEERVKQV